MAPLKTKKKHIIKKRQRTFETQQLSTNVHTHSSALSPSQPHPQPQTKDLPFTKELSKQMRLMNKLDNSIKTRDNAEFEYILRHLSVKQLQTICKRSNISYEQAEQKHPLTHKQLCIILKRSIKTSHNHTALIGVIEMLSGLASLRFLALGTFEKNEGEYIMNNVSDVVSRILGLDEIIFPIFYNMLYDTNDFFDIYRKNTMKPYYTLSSLLLFAMLFIRKVKSRSIKRNKNIKLLIVKEILKYQTPMKKHVTYKRKKWWMI